MTRVLQSLIVVISKPFKTLIRKRYCEYNVKEKCTFDEFLRKKGYTDARVKNDPIYRGQIRVVPKDQLEEAIKWLEKKIIDYNY